MSATLSVIIPTFKRLNSLQRVLGLLLNQETIAPEIIVVDQNPPGFFDGATEQLLKRVKHLRLEHPNASTARNTGFRESSSPYILFIDDDLVPETDFCRKALDIFRQYPNIKCFSPLVYSEIGTADAISAARRKKIAYHPTTNEIFSISDTISAAVFFERSYYEASGGFDEQLFDFAKTAEDQEFFLRMQKKKLVLWYIPGISIFHDEGVPGGCDLRTTGYWETRKKCMRAWAYRYRSHNAVTGKLSIPDLLRLSRSAFLNRAVLSSGLTAVGKQMKLMFEAISDSKRCFEGGPKHFSPLRSYNAKA